MEYVEFLRARRTLLVFAVLFTIAAIITIVSAHFGSVSTGGDQFTISNTPQAGRSIGTVFAATHIPLGLLLGLASYSAIPFATVLSSSLNKENDGANFVFTKPISRTNLAVRYMAIDGIAIVALFVLACALVSATVAGIGLIGTVYVDEGAPWIVFLGLGSAVMWYGIMQAVTATYRGKGGIIVAWSWAVFGILTFLPGLRLLGPFVLGIVHVLNIFNPIAYLASLVSTSGGFRAGTVLDLPIETRSALSFAIGIACCVIASRIWNRVEV